MNVCIKCKHGFYSGWSNVDQYNRYSGCPYSSHTHYPRRQCVFFEEGDIPFCPQHKKDMKLIDNVEDVKIYQCTVTSPSCYGGPRKVWVHKNGIKRQVVIEMKSPRDKYIIEEGFDLEKANKPIAYE